MKYKRGDTVRGLGEHKGKTGTVISDWGETVYLQWEGRRRSEVMKKFLEKVIHA